MNNILSFIVGALSLLTLFSLIKKDPTTTKNKHLRRIIQYILFPISIYILTSITVLYLPRSIVSVVIEPFLISKYDKLSVLHGEESSNIFLVDGKPYVATAETTRNEDKMVEISDIKITNLLTDESINLDIQLGPIDSHYKIFSSTSSLSSYSKGFWNYLDNHLNFYDVKGNSVSATLDHEYDSIRIIEETNSSISFFASIENKYSILILDRESLKSTQYSITDIDETLELNSSSNTDTFRFYLFFKHFSRSLII